MPETHEPALDFLVSQRSQVHILPPLLVNVQVRGPFPGGEALCCAGMCNQIFGHRSRLRLLRVRDALAWRNVPLPADGWDGW